MNSKLTATKVKAPARPKDCRFGSINCYRAYCRDGFLEGGKRRFKVVAVHRASGDEIGGSKKNCAEAKATLEWFRRYRHVDYAIVYRENRDGDMVPRLHYEFERKGRKPRNRQARPAYQAYGEHRAHRRGVAKKVRRGF